jgi:hypothetical protein
MSLAAAAWLQDSKAVGWAPRLVHSLVQIATSTQLLSLLLTVVTCMGAVRAAAMLQAGLRAPASGSATLPATRPTA